MRLDISWLTPELASGAFVPREAMEQVAKTLRIARVVDLRAETAVDPALWAQHGVLFLRVPTLDHHPIERSRLLDAVHWILAGLRKNERILIHCQHGIGRSALLACCVLVQLGHDPCKALELVKRARPVVSPHPEQLYCLLSFARDVKRECAGPALTATWDELAAIAYASQPSAVEGLPR